MPEIKLTLEEFRQNTKDNPQGFNFKIICLKCNSDKVALEIDGNSIGTGGGCDSCGHGGGSDLDLEVLFKCKECGNAYHATRTED